MVAAVRESNIQHLAGSQCNGFWGVSIRTWDRTREEKRKGIAETARFGNTKGGNAGVFAVGAVYDRATFASEWAKCAVIDRAYSGTRDGVAEGSEVNP